MSYGHDLIHFEIMFLGTIDSATIHPREVVKTALRHNASAVILAHNHPSGVAEPSSADQAITRRIVDALALVDVRVLDHVVVGATETVSLSRKRSYVGRDRDRYSPIKGAVFLLVVAGA